MRATTRTFLIGLGAQKAGTTWIHQYLVGSPQVVRGYRKEYHVLDSVDLVEDQWRQRNLDMAQAELGHLRRLEEADPVHLHRAAMIADPEVYLDHVTGLLRRRPRFRVTSDITPEYALLSTERLRWVREGVEARRTRSAVLFVMRDPVERIWSQVRMQEGRRPDRFPRSADLMVEELYRLDPYAALSRYESTLERIEQVWGPEDRHYAFYETLFDVDRVRELCAFLCVDYREPDFDRRANVSVGKSVTSLPKDLVREVAEHFAPTYHAVAERFPEVDLLTLWPSSRFVLQR